jgi:hypothetical protein
VHHHRSRLSNATFFALMGVGPWVDRGLTSRGDKTFAPILIWISVCHAMPFLAAMVLFFLLPVIVFFL